MEILKDTCGSEESMWTHPTYGAGVTVGEGLIYLVTDGDVGTLPAVVPRSLHAVLTDGLVAD